ncbi:MAG: PTS-dependent dihydroxyacetone kinase phosphotransferase subunit DhaM [Clostridiales bacterium]|nr:PTS-dependent dihydroxyacetone kinase phosphotransferase subunit DhaM [Clostridiales bacterium]
MVGFVFVSHSQKLAEGVAELASLMAPDVKLIPAGGAEDGRPGTSMEKILAAVSEADASDGVLILADLGSSVMTAQMAAEMLERDDVELIDCPLVEGAVAGAAAAAGGLGREAVKAALEKSWLARKC